MIDNFQKISDLFINYSDEDTYYYAFICQRKKENPEIGADNHIIKDYYFDARRPLEKYRDQIIKLCETFNARAYFHLNKRSYQRTSYEAMMTLARNLRDGNFRTNKGLWSTESGWHHVDKDKKWIIDVDTRDYTVVCEIIDYINNIRPLDQENKIKTILDTKNGYHIITCPFDLKEFGEITRKNKERWGIDDLNNFVQKSNPTILYVI